MDNSYSNSSRRAGRANAGYTSGSFEVNEYYDFDSMLRDPDQSPTSSANVTERPRRTTRASAKSQFSTSAVQATRAVDSTHSTEDADNSWSTESKGQFPDWVLKAHTLNDDKLIAKLVEASYHEGSKYYDAVVKKDPTSLIDSGVLPPSVGTKYLDERYSWGFQGKSGLLVVNRVSGKQIAVESKSDLYTCYDSVWKPIMEAVTEANAPMSKHVENTFKSKIKSAIHALAMSFGPLQMGTDNIIGITTYLLRDSKFDYRVWERLGLGDEKVYDYRWPKVEVSQSG